MSIFLIALLAFLIGTLVSLVVALCFLVFDADERCYKICAAVAIVVFISGTFIGIGMNTDSEKVYIANYNAQKTTIEQSLTSDVLTGLERVELVKQASELNGEVSQKKAQYDIWHYICYGGNLFKNVELIDLSGGQYE